MKTSVLVISSVALALAITVMLVSQKEVDEGLVSDAMEVETPLLDLKAFLSEFEENETEANLKYIGRPVHLRATLSAVGKQADGVDYFILSDAASPLSIKCYLVPETLVGGEGLLAGDSVLVTGFYEGKQLMLNMGFCTIISSDKSAM